MTMDDLPEAVGIPAPSSDADEGLHRPGVTGSIPRVQSADDSQDTHGGSDGATESSTASPFEKTATDLVPGHGFVRAPTHYKELAPLVAMLPPSDAVAHNRLAKQSYSRLGRNLLFEARPAVVHFGGYVVGKPHSQRVRVVNISSTSQRLHILGPATDCFKMRCNKKGLVAPGSSEIITVDFHPREHRYHYDCLRLHTDSQNLLVPMHAYPVMNDVVFPERLDFGVHALGETIRRTVKMVCKVPIQFEFEIEVTKSHPHFNIGPLRGIVPANGAAEVHIEHTPARASSAEMKLLINVSQFNFTPIVCTVTGAGRPGVVREAALDATASELARDDALQDSLGPSRNNHAQAQARKLRGQRARERYHSQHQRKATGSKSAVGMPLTQDAGCQGDGGGGLGDPVDGVIDPRQEGGSGPRERQGSVKGDLKGVEEGDEGGWGETPLRGTGSGEAEAGGTMSTAGEGAELVDTWGVRPTSAEQHPYRTGKGSGAVFDVGGEWLATKKRDGSMQPAEPWAPPAEGSVFGSVGGPTKTTVVEGLVIPACLDTVQATNFVLTQQPGKLKPKDLKEAIRRTRAERQHQLQEQEALRSLAAAAPAENSVGRDDVARDGDPDRLSLTQAEKLGKESGVVGLRGQEQAQQPSQLGVRAICAYEAAAVRSGGGGAATRQLKEMSFLQDLADLEAEERDRTFKASIEHIGEPLLTPGEAAKALQERRRGQRRLRRKRREVERASIETCLKGPGQVGARHARASLLCTCDGTQGIGFRHKPDWDVYKNDDWGRRREVLRRLVNAVGAWIVRRRAGRRLAAIQARLGGLRDRAEVAAMVERDNLEAKLTAGPPASSASQASWKLIAAGGGCEREDDDSSSWEFPELLVTSEALAAEMLSESLIAPAMALYGGSGGASSDMRGGSTGARGDGYFRRSSGMPIPPPPEFRLSAGDISRHMFPIYDEGAALSRREEVVDAVGPPSDFVEMDLLPLREPEEARSMGYVTVAPPGLGTYPSIETTRPLRWSAFEECGVRQPRDEEAEASGSVVDREASEPGVVSSGGWRQALSSTERRQSKATLGRRRSSVGLRMVPSTADNTEEAWLQEADAELTALAAEAEKVDRMPDSLLLRPPPPGGVDLITPDPRYKAFLAELPVDEASPEWCLRPQEIPREVPVTKGLLLGYSPGTTTLRAYANAPRLSNHWKPRRTRRSSGLACMRGQASRGVWHATRAPAPSAATPVSRRGDKAVGRLPDSGVVSGVGRVRDRSPKGRAGGGTGGARKFQLAADHEMAAAAAGDGLSDSESEDDEDDAPIPTPADARTLFDDTAMGRSPEGGQPLREGREGGGGELRAGDGATGVAQSEGVVGVGVSGAKGFERELAMSALEDSRRRTRMSDAERLADRMGAIAAQIQNVKHAFVLQTPFHRIRPHEPDGA